MRFSEIYGQTELKSTLIDSVKNNHIAHAQLFLGSDGSANLALALAYVSFINCENRQETDSCGVCSQCRQTDKFTHPDWNFIFPTATTKKITKAKEAVSQTFLKDWRTALAENPYISLSDWAAYFGAENKQCNISKEESRTIIRSLSLKAFSAAYKVTLIWLPEFMHPSAANAILKILEEPPEKTLFLLVANNSEKLLTTILSRTQIVKVPPFSDAEIKKYLEEKLAIESSQAAHIAYLAEGDLNEAQKLSQEVVNNSVTFFKEWMRSCFKSNFTELVAKADDFQKLGKEQQKSLMQYSLGIFRESLIIMYSGKDLLRVTDEELSFVQNFSKILNANNLEKFVHLVNDAYYHIERNANPKILFLNLSINIAKNIK